MDVHRGILFITKDKGLRSFIAGKFSAEDANSGVRAYSATSAEKADEWFNKMHEWEMALGGDFDLRAIIIDDDEALLPTLGDIGERFHSPAVFVITDDPDGVSARTPAFGKTSDIKATIIPRNEVESTLLPGLRETIDRETRYWTRSIDDPDTTKTGDSPAITK